MERRAPLAGPAAVRDARRRSSSATDSPLSIAPVLTPAERAEALSRLGRPAPAGESLDAARLDAARARLRAAATPEVPLSRPAEVDPDLFDAAQRRLRSARAGRRGG